MAIELITKNTMVARNPRVSKRSTIVVSQEIIDEPTVLSNHIPYRPPSNVDIYGEPQPIKAVEVDVQRNYNVKTVDTANLKSDTVSTSVNNSVDKLRALRNGNRTSN